MDGAAYVAEVREQVDLLMIDAFDTHGFAPALVRKLAADTHGAQALVDLPNGHLYLRGVFDLDRVRGLATAKKGYSYNFV